jgi:hypothetical protein
VLVCDAESERLTATHVVARMGGMSGKPTNKPRRRWFVPADNPEGYNLTRKEWRRDTTVVILITALLCALAGFWFVRTALFIGRASKATGTLTEFSQREDNTTWEATATISDSTGAVRTVQATWLQPFSWPSVEEGVAVSVLYDSAAPDHADIDAFETLWCPKLWVTGVVLGLWSAGAFFVLIFRYPPGSRLLE